MAEVEAQTPRLHERSGLMRVLAEPVAKDPVKDVRRGVSPLRVGPPRRVHRRLHVRTWSEVAARDTSLVPDQAEPRMTGKKLLGVDDLGGPPRSLQHPAVSDLSAAFCVERCAIENDIDLIPFARGPLTRHEQHPAIAVEMLVSDELRAAVLGEDGFEGLRVGRSANLAATRAAGPGALLIHQAIESSPVEREL